MFNNLLFLVANNIIFSKKNIFVLIVLIPQFTLKSLLILKNHSSYFQIQLIAQMDRNLSYDDYLKKYGAQGYNFEDCLDLESIESSSLQYFGAQSYNFHDCPNLEPRKSGPLQNYGSQGYNSQDCSNLESTQQNSIDSDQSSLDQNKRSLFDNMKGYIIACLKTLKQKVQESGFQTKISLALKNHLTQTKRLDLLGPIQACIKQILLNLVYILGSKDGTGIDLMYTFNSVKCVEQLQEQINSRKQNKLENQKKEKVPKKTKQIQKEKKEKIPKQTKQIEQEKKQRKSPKISQRIRSFHPQLLGRYTEEVIDIAKQNLCAVFYKLITPQWIHKTVDKRDLTIKSKQTLEKCLIHFREGLQKRKVQNLTKKSSKEVLKYNIFASYKVGKKPKTLKPKLEHQRSGQPLEIM